MKTRNKTRKSWTQSTSSGSDRGAGAQRLLPAHSGSHGSGASNQGSRALPTLHSRLQFFDEKWLHAVSKIWVGSLLSFGCYISSIMSVAFWYVCSFVSNSLWPHGCNPPGSSAHGIFQARILEWVAISYSRGSSRSTDWTQVSRVSWITRRILYQFSSVQFSRSVVSNSATPWIAARQASLSITNSRVHSDSRPSSQWCHPAISSSVVPFSSCPKSLPESGSFPMSELFTWGGQSTGVSASTSVLPMNTQDWSPLERTGWISLQSKGLSRVFCNTTVQKHQFFGAQPSSQSNSHI